jgi:acetyl-CoA acetyltransferase
MANQLVAGGMADCVLALGFEKMQRGSLSSTYDDRTNPLDKVGPTSTPGPRGCCFFIFSKK